MKILMVSAAILPFWKCGVATVVDDISVALQEQGHAIGMFALDINGYKDSQTQINGIQCWLTAAFVSDKCAYVSDSALSTKHVCDRFEECISIFQPDIVHFHTPQYFSLSLIENAKKAGARTVVTLHDWWWVCPTQFFSSDLGQKCKQVSRENCLRCMQRTKEGEKEYTLRERAMNAIEEYVDAFTCVSRVLYNDLVRIRPWLKNKVHIIPNPVPEVVDSLLRIEGPLTFSFLGGMHEIKGYFQVMEAFSAIEAAGTWKLNIYGGMVQNLTKSKKSIIGYFIKVIKYLVHPIRFVRKIKSVVYGARIEQKNHSAINHLPAFDKEEIQNVLSNTHVVLVCSQVQESFSLVAYEAMANGCCVISTKCGGPEEIVRSGENGILLDTFDGKALERAVRYLIDNRDTVESYRKNAHELAKSFMRKSEIGRKYYEIYSVK